MLKFICTCMFSFLFTVPAFSNDLAAKFIGLYEYESTLSGNKEVMEIVRSENRYFVLDISGKYYLLTVAGDALVFSGEKMVLSKDKQTMTFNGLEYLRVKGKTKQDRLDELDPDERLCRSLDEEAAREYAVLVVANKDADSWNQYVDELQKRRPSGCILVKDGKLVGF